MNIVLTPQQLLILAINMFSCGFLLLLRFIYTVEGRNRRGAPIIIEEHPPITQIIVLVIALDVLVFNVGVLLW